MKAILIFVALLLSMKAFGQNCEAISTILAENTKASVPVYSKIKETIRADEKLKKDVSLSELSEPSENVSLMYLADINNDGKREYVFTSPGSGSGGFINIFVFEKVGDKFNYLGSPPKPTGLGDGPWYFNWHRSPVTRQIQFLVSGCGSTFMLFDLGPEHKLERYLWRSGQTERVSVK